MIEAVEQHSRLHLQDQNAKEEAKTMTNAQVLIVEDESIVAENIRTRLLSLGYAVSAVVSSGQEAVQEAAETHPDLVLMDIKLEGDMDGVEAAEQIRARFDIPVVYLTAYANDDTLQRAKITEPFGYILKPFEVRELQTAIELALYKHKMESKLKQSERWLATTLRSIGDGVIATDAKGCVVFMNPVAEALTGWKQEEAWGRDLTKVFNIIDEETHKVTETPATKAIREGVVLGLANHTLIPRDGAEIAIGDSAAPIRDDKGNVSGAVLVFRDITERKRAEEELQQTFEKLQRTLEGTVHALTATAERRDPYTAGHQQRVTRLACAIAQEMGFPEEQIEGIRVAGLIHDIGKINVPAEILSKPGVLNEIEYPLIKAHPQTGHDILKTIEFPWPVAQIVLQHHERMDGSGYPAGLSGEEIIPEARILGVADVVEAMASHRPYRPARGLDKALEEISQNRGVLYDPEVVDACLKLFTEKGFTFE